MERLTFVSIILISLATLALGIAAAPPESRLAGGPRVSPPPISRGLPTVATCERPQQASRSSPLVRINFWKAQFVETLPALFLAETALALAFFASTYALGAMVARRGWSARYTRKAVAAAMLAAPFLIALVVVDAPNPLHVSVSFLILLSLHAFFVAPVRRRLPFFETAFASIDRPEDRPHTISWFLSGFAASSILLMIMMWLAAPDQPAYVFVAFMAVAVGDLLAGVVGQRFGRHSYRTGALFTRQSYTRTVEGSFCVAATTIAALLCVKSNLPADQFWLALALMPGALALAEAKSPHRWDEPVMLAAATAAAMAIVTIVGGC